MPPATPPRRPKSASSRDAATSDQPPPRSRARSTTRRPITDAPRLQLVLARAGVASRREAEGLIVGGRVSVDGVTVRELGTRVDPSRHRIAVDGRPIARALTPRYLMLNKPTGYVTTADDPDGRPTVMQLVPPVPGLFPVGRLDVASEGLILLTTDGEWAQRASHPKFGCLKEYLVDVTGDASPSALATMRAPMVIGPNDRTTGAQVDMVSSTRHRSRLRIVLHEGRNRQIRRMCETVGLDVVELVRVKVGGIGLGSLAPGEWRDLLPHEVVRIAQHVATKPLPSSVRSLRLRGAAARRDVTGVPPRPDARPTGNTRPTSWREASPRGPR